MLHFSEFQIQKAEIQIHNAEQTLQNATDKTAKSASEVAEKSFGLAEKAYELAEKAVEKLKNFPDNENAKKLHDQLLERLVLSICNAKESSVSTDAETFVSSVRLLQQLPNSHACTYKLTSSY